MTRPQSTLRIAGWLLAGAVALGLVGGAAAVALAAERRPSVLVLDLGTRPPSAPAFAAVSEAAPDVAPAEPSLPDPSDSRDAAPVIPDVVSRPILAAAAPVTLPEIESPVTADLSLPAAEAEPEAKPEPTPRPKARPAPKPAAEAKRDRKREKPPADDPPQADKPASSASAPTAAANTRGGDVSPAAYAKAVMKKVRATKRKTGAGRGTVVVGFTIASDGGLAAVQVLRSSGNGALDNVAVDHIRRSAPFPPPSGAPASYSFEFIGK